MATLRLRAAVLAASLFASSSVLAITQPDGTPIPQGLSLQQILAGQGEPIVPSTQAAVTPETFTPGCALTFTVLSRDSAYRNAFGWYNVTGAAPAPAELYEFITCNDAVGVQKVLDVRKDPRYLGGDIGFFERTPQNTGSSCAMAPGGYVFFSQRAYNPDNSSYHLLIMDSKVFPSAFYFAWEDLLSGGDNDFQDLLMRVEGIQCTGGGTQCETGAIGPCKFGAQQCVDGVLECKQTQLPQGEKCNNVDDDCNGLVDDPPDLCPPEQICDRGTCVPKCGTGEFMCNGNEVCTPKGVCVDPLCAAVDCETGKVCVAGNCVGGCEGVVCPYGQTCNGGVCFSPCAGVTCPDPKDHCENGVCVKGCECGGCAAGLTCVANGTCVPQACIGVGCSPGQHCDATGACIDDCAGAVCPKNQLCQAGSCVDDPDAGAAGTGPGTGGGPIIPGTGGSAAGVGTGGTTSGTGGSGGKGSLLSRGDTSAAESGCGCRTAESSSRGALSLAALGLLAALTLRRSRRRGKSA
jgi:MYXO-CTERM domain-containing protein